MFLSIIVLIVFCSSSSVCYVGKTCKSNSSCKDEHLLAFPTDSNEYQCLDGVCKCSTEEHLKFDDNTLTPTCSLLTYISSFDNDLCTSQSCPENAECVGAEHGPRSERKKCRCKAGFLKLNDKCKEVYHQRVLEECKVQDTGPVLFCDINEYSYCKNGRCICFDAFFANTTSGKCEPISEYLEVHNLTKYQVSPGEYCKQDDECIEGLACVNFSCSCPLACPYQAEEEICDCGEEPPSSLTGPVIVGILGGILIIVFWAYQIKKTIKRHGTKKRDKFDALPSDGNEGTPVHDGYPLKPVDFQTMTHGTFGSPGQLNPPPSSTDGRPSPLAPPVVSDDSLPPKVEGEQVPSYAVPPPQLSLYGTNPPQAPYPQNPFPLPSEAENLSETNALPYSINPPTVGSSAPPLPYPSNPSVAPYPTNPSGMPYGLDPSVPRPSSPYGVSAFTAKQGAENTEAPPPYNPNYP